MGTIESSALKCLREKIYAHRAELTSAFAQYDLNGTGNVQLPPWGKQLPCACGGRGDKPHGDGSYLQRKAGRQHRLVDLVFFLTTVEERY